MTKTGKFGKSLMLWGVAKKRIMTKLLIKIIACLHRVKYIKFLKDRIDITTNKSLSNLKPLLLDDVGVGN